ncbi:retrotransposon protein, putative, ty1-copia subclass [Tanacetum coccineum]
MKGYLDQLECLCFLMPNEPGVSLILNYLSKDYEQFMQNYIMHSMGKTIDVLHAMLKLYEKGILKKVATHAFLPIKGDKIQLKKSKLQAAKGKRNGKGKGLRGILKMKQGALNLYVGNGMRVAVEAIRSFDLILHNGLIIVLVSCLYAHIITRCVVSLSRLVGNGFIHKFTDYGISVSKDNVNYFNDIPRDGIYKIDMHNLVPNVSSIYNVSNKRTKHNSDSTYLWHCRLGHINKKHIAKLQHYGLLKSTNDESFDKCISCISGKMAHKPFPPEKERAKDLLRLIHIDVYVPFRTMSREGASCFITFTDDFNRCYPKKPWVTIYYFYYPPENKIFVARYAEFSESGLISQEASGSKIPQAPDRYGFYVDAEEHELGDHNEPANYKASLTYPEYGKWVEAMNAKMQSMKDNQVWCFVNLSPDCRTVGRKWLFKKKTNTDENVHTFKVRLVAKGYT